jgi:hypothetical protein
VTPILRHTPGEIVPRTGTYALVGHFGESTDFAVWCNEGERLPLVTVAAETGPFWFVHVDESDEPARAA